MTTSLSLLKDISLKIVSCILVSPNVVLNELIPLSTYELVCLETQGDPDEQFLEKSHDTRIVGGPPEQVIEYRHLLN